MFEVEAKFVVDSFAIIEQQYEFEDPVLEKDVYYQHPSRDFLNSDEWLRLRTTIRQNNATDLFVVTYKGAKLITESGIKTRQEIEFKASNEIVELLKILGFKKFVRVEKYRRKSKSSYGVIECNDLCNDLNVMITLDDVVGLGKYVEIEVLVEDFNEKLLAINVIETISMKLGLDKYEKRGYAKMILNEIELGRMEKSIWTG